MEATFTTSAGLPPVISPSVAGGAVEAGDRLVEEAHAGNRRGARQAARRGRRPVRRPGRPAPSARAARPSPARRGALPPVVECGVELSSPKTACACARARVSASPGWSATSWADPQLDVLPLQRPHSPPGGLGEGGPVAVLHHDQRLVVQREVDVPAHQRHHRLGRALGRRDPLAAHGQELLADRDEHLGQHRVLRGEVPVERRTADPAGRADLAHGDAAEAAFGEELRGDGQDLRPALGAGPAAHLPRLSIVNRMRRGLRRYPRGTRRNR